jgi:hypothetical protein
MWELVIVYGISMSHKPSIITEPMKNEHQCYMVANNSNIALDTNNSGSILLYCRPKENK